MSNWTMEDTEDFTQSELDMINSVREILLAEFQGDPERVDDALTNAWEDGISPDELAHEAMELLLG
jgi:hypothetical protein